MRLWIPVAAGAMVLVAYAFLYALGSVEGQGGVPLGLANAVGIAGVIVGLVAAALIFRRGAPPDKTREPGNP